MESRQLSATAHEMMNNGDAFAHQQMAQTQKPSAPTTVENATPFSEMDDYEKAMVIHQSMNNAHSFAHEIQADRGFQVRIPQINNFIINYLLLF